MRVDSQTRLKFAPFSLRVGRTDIELNPFFWDAATLELNAADPSRLPAVLKTWFLSWFDTEDVNTRNAEGLYGVVHFMSDPEIAEQRCSVNIDLGSASEHSLEDLLFRLSDASAQSIRIR